MKRNLIFFGVGIIACLAMLKGLLPATARGIVAEPYPAPEFINQNAEDWINSPPLTIGALKNKVVLVDFWTFDCRYCYRSFPWLNAMEHRLKDEAFLVVGVHSPEFEHEKVKANIVAKVKEFKLRHPVMIDNNHAYWRAIKNRYWPAFYILDKQGQVRALFIGKTHEGDKQAKKIEATIKALLAEPNIL